jgi:pyruvate dehydrogenase complex dehydrogenase (E1) component
MLERNRTKDILIGVMTVAMIVISSVALYAYNRSKNAPLVSPSRTNTLTNTDEVALQQQIAGIIASKNESDCATLTNENYRLACEQFFKPTQIGTQLVPIQGENFSTTSLEALVNTTREKSGTVVKLSL